MKVRGQNWNRNAVKQTAESGQKSQVMTTRPVLHHWCQVSTIWGCRMVLNTTERDRFTMASPTKWFRLITNIWNCSRDLAWLQGGTTDVTNTRTNHFFRCLFTVLLLKIRPWTFTIGFYGKESVKALMVLECSFPLHFHKQHYSIHFLYDWL